MILAVVIIGLLVLLVIVDGADSSGVHPAAQPEAETFQADGKEAAAGGPCVLAVKPVSGGNPSDQRKRAWRPARSGQAKVAQG
jgi:hypothetical protein